MNHIIKKLKYVIQTGYYPYFGYLTDLITERELKYRTGKCVDCIECCHYFCDVVKTCKSECYCKYADIKNKRCKVYNNRDCNVWFPISQKEIDYRKSIQRNFTCNFHFCKK